MYSDKRLSLLNNVLKKYLLEKINQKEDIDLKIDIEKNPTYRSKIRGRTSLALYVRLPEWCVLLSTTSGEFFEISLMYAHLYNHQLFFQMNDEILQKIVEKINNVTDAFFNPKIDDLISPYPEIREISSLKMKYYKNKHKE